jgi:hypothetical protein
MDPNNENSNNTPAAVLEAVVNPFAERVHATLEAAKSPEQASSAEILIVDGSLSLTNIEQVWRTARLIRQSGMAPTSFRNDQQIVIAVLRALELRIPIFQALEGMSVINNRIGIMGDLALALVQGSGLLEKKSVEYTGEGDELVCTLTIKRKGRSAQPYTFSVKEARNAGLYDRSTTWKGYPRRMCYYRALGFALRDEFPDVLKGIKTTEELMDYPEPQNSHAR